MKACIFDLDGTLLDSLQVWEQLDTAFLQRRGVTVPEDYADTVASLSIREAAVYTIQRFALAEDADTLIAEWKALALHAYSHTVMMKPYAKEYLHKLKTTGVKLAIATSLPHVLSAPALDRHGITPLFDAICSADETAHGKNSPDIYILAATRLGIPARHYRDIVVFEDILQAIRSAKSTGMIVYGVYDEASARHWETVKQVANGVIYDFREAPSS
ncbi:MAG: HAD family phosphatase [Gracilibacteraceae bacterium]|jgi:beta-phosphoglucomutase-like phosphatase (HAD superfamily)|nr:HAD family phosphatase [Gracilibacteraceae bacterium]